MFIMFAKQIISIKLRVDGCGVECSEVEKTRRVCIFLFPFFFFQKRIANITVKYMKCCKNKKNG